ncbi:K02A2.6-like, partial [Pristimantis euphronides]
MLWDQGRLYRETIPTGGQEGWRRERHLVVPQLYRAELLRLAHEIPLAGHLGVAKTKARLAHLFYWPKMGADVAKYCRSCVTCQRMGKAGPGPKAPLVTLPIIEEPFQRIAVDLIGPLPTPSSSGKRYILTVVDYATRYPEAVALSSIRADVVAKALLEIFTRVGFPREMLTDRGTQFMSDLMQSLCEQTEVRHLVSSPYHPQTNGLCERFNGTLKQMLKMLVESQGRDWERCLPYLLFAYREVPQASTGFSPFELLYGRRVRGLLTLVRESWEEEAATPGVSVVEYVSRFRDKMQTLTKLVHDNMVQAQADQKSWYDQHARERTYKEGQKVWVLVPVPQDKLQAKWEGPYSVHQQISCVNYLITIDPVRNRQKVFHVNMMKAHYDREACTLPVCSLPEEGEEEGLVDLLAHARAGGSMEDAHVNSRLAKDQQSQLGEVLRPHPGLFTGRPGKTKLAVHHVDTGNHRPIRRSAYRVSLEVQEQMRKEIAEMLELGVIRPSNSAWASPVVLVPKKDRTTRFCVDYRGLNAITTDDAYPMPRIDDLLDRLGKAQYLTIMDLSRGYWQIPLSPEAQERSAFITPFGLYESTVMPFGMKNAPATFQRMVNNLLMGCEGFAAAYLDDIAIFSPTWEDHLQHLSEVLERIHQAGLTIKPGKCQLGMNEVQYLGHRVGGGT